MKLRLFVLCILLIHCGAALAAGPLPASTPTGILADRVVPFAHFDELDGSANAPTAGLARWRQTLHELQRSSQSDLGWEAPRSIQAAGLADAEPNEIPLALLHARYDRMVDAEKTASAEVLVLGALRDNVYYGSNLAFRLDPDRIFTHQTSPVVEMQFNADDGLGPRPLIAGQPLWVSYATTGTRSLTLQALLKDGRTVTARAALNVKRLATPDPTQTWAINATQSYGGAFASGQAYVYLAPGRTTLRNPVVVVEGFDLDNSMDWPVLYDLLNQENLLEDLRLSGYDAVVLDFTEAVEPIQRNAFVLTELLAQVNATIPAGKSVGLVGASMGGLVSRYALLWLESQAIDANVRTYVSFDSPHLGANIPLGMQHWLNFFQGESTDAAYLLSRLNTQAAKQMLLYHYQRTSGSTAAADPLRAAWLADLTALGDWPVNPRLVAVANGSANGVNQGFGAGAQIIDYEYYSFLVDLIGNVWSVPDGGAARTIFDGEINVIWPLPDTNQTVSVGGTQPWDNAPGGYRGSMAEMDATVAPYGDIVALFDNHCFIPTISALALDGVGPFHDVAGDAQLMTRTPFDALYYPVASSANQGHIALTAESKPWLLAEVQAGVSGVQENDDRRLTFTELAPPSPNPFNPITRITYSLAQTGPIDLSVFDVRGRRVTTLFQGLGKAGERTVVWRGRDQADRPVPAGVYFVNLESEGARDTRRVVLVK